MATNTTNLSLIKPSGTDKIRIAQINQNMDILDEKIGPVGSASLQAQMSTVTGYTTMSNGTNLNTLTNKANYLVGNISQMLNAPTGAGTSGFFYVEKNSSYILQRFWGDSDKAYRFSYNNGSTWNSWVVHKTQIDSLNRQIAKVKNFGIVQVQATLANQVVIGAGQDGKIFDNVNLKTGNVLTTFAVGSLADIPDTVKGILLLWMSGGGNCYANDQIAWTDGKVTLGVRNISSGSAIITAVRLLLFGTYN